MPAAIIRADYDRLTETAASFGEQASQVRQALQALSRQSDTLQGGDWLGQGASAFYSEMNAQVIPTLNRLVRALEQAADTTRQINLIAQQAEKEAAAFFKLDGNGNGAGAAIAAAAAGLGANGSANGGGTALPPGVSALRKPGDAGGGGGTGSPSKRLGVTGSPEAKAGAERILNELATHNPKLAEAIQKDPALRSLLERVDHAGYFVWTAQPGEGGLSVPDSTLNISPNTSVALFKDMAKDAINNPRILRQLDPKLAAAIKKDPVLLERVVNWDDNGHDLSLVAGDGTAGYTISRAAGATTVAINPKDPAASLSRALTSLERGTAMDWPIERTFPNHRDQFLKEGVRDRLTNDAAEIFHLLRAQQVATGRMTSNLPNMGKVQDPAIYQTIVKFYLDGTADEGTAIASITEMLETEPPGVTKRAQYEAQYAKKWADHAAKVKAGGSAPAQPKP